MDIVLIKENSPEWNYMWETLAKHPKNEGLDEPSVANNPLNDEKWKYRCSWRGNDNKVIHEFFHRSLPTTNEPATYLFEASQNFNDNDINKVLSVK